jgi:hypothetical protein
MTGFRSIPGSIVADGEGLSVGLGEDSDLLAVGVGVASAPAVAGGPTIDPSMMMTNARSRSAKSHPAISS